MEFCGDLAAADDIDGPEDWEGKGEDDKTTKAMVQFEQAIR